MNTNIFYGIVVVVLCMIGYIYSWKYTTKEKYNIAVFLLLLCGLLLRIYISTDFFLHSWDERYHALVAKNLIQHPLKPTLYENPLLPYDYKNWAGNHIWLHKQPLPLWTMAASMWLFGVNEIALRIPSILLTTIGIWLTFAIGSYFFNKKIGYLAAFFYSINGLIIELTGGRVATDHIDIFFLFFIELSIFFIIKFIKNKNTLFNFLVGLSIGAAILSKWLPALIVLPVWFLLVINSGKFQIRSIISQFVLLITTILIVVVPWQLYIFKSFPLEASWEASYNIKHITDVLGENSRSILYFINKIRINYGELIYIPLIWFIWKTFKNIHDKKRMAIAIWAIIPLLFFSFVKTKMQAYILFTAPALFLITSEFFHVLLAYKRKHKFKILFEIILILLIALPIRYSVERLKPFEQRVRKPQWVIELKELNDRNIEKGVLFNYARPVEAMFYTNLTVYSTIPERRIINDILSEGYTVIINDNGNITEQIAAIKGVKIKKIAH